VDRNRLDGWKAIASHLNRSERQCQRLVAMSGMPVHRVPGTRAVFAFVEELDRWLLGETDETSETDHPGDVKISRSGHHVTLPVELVAIRPGEEHREAGPSEPAPAEEPPQNRRKLLPILALVLLTLVLLALGIHHRHVTGWRNVGTPLTGSWTFKGSGVVGRSESVARYDTGHLAAPGTTTAITLSSCGTRWSGGLEIFQDDLHWTFVALSPREHEIVVQRFPAGTVKTFFTGQAVEPARPVELRVAVGDSILQVGCTGRNLYKLAMDPWDVSRGRLILRVGSPGDELHEPSGGTCSFRDLKVTNAPDVVPPSTVHDVPPVQRPAASYVLAADNIDDQLDVLIDGRRLASAGYREEIGPLDIGPFLTRGQHTITALLFNRKWTAAYGIRLMKNGAELWNERCGDVRKIHSGCQEIGDRLGMVKRLSFTFEAR